MSITKQSLGFKVQQTETGLGTDFIDLNEERNDEQRTSCRCVTTVGLPISIPSALALILTVRER